MLRGVEAEEVEEAGGGIAAAVAAVVERPGDAHSLPLDPVGTAFQRRVWEELLRIPCGETITYAELAARSGSPRAIRAAGAGVALRKCHAGR